MVPERVRGPGIPAVQAAARWCLQHPTQASKPCSRVAIQRQFRKASTQPYKLPNYLWTPRWI